MNRNRNLNKLVLRLAVVSIPLGLAACSTAGASPSVHHGKVDGKLLIEGGTSKDFGPRGISGTVYLTEKGSKTVTINVGNSGRFDAMLPVGTYSLTGRTFRVQGPGGTPTTCRSTKPIVIRAGKTTSVNFMCAIVP